jgi:hypothetical protein
LAEWIAGQVLLGRQATRHSEGSTHTKGEHAIGENTSALSTPATAGKSDAVGPTPGANASARASTTDADAAAGHSQSRPGKEQP